VYLGVPVLALLFAAGFWFYESKGFHVSAPAPPYLDTIKQLEQQWSQKYGPQPTPPVEPTVSPNTPPPPPPPPTQQSSSDAPAIPDFPGPPPRASAWAAVPNALVLAGAQTPTFEEVEARLGRALDAAGYYQRSLFAVPHGFAVVTQLERIEADGVPAS